MLLVKWSGTTPSAVTRSRSARPPPTATSGGCTGRGRRAHASPWASRSTSTSSCAVPPSSDRPPRPARTAGSTGQRRAPAARRAGDDRRPASDGGGVRVRQGLRGRRVRGHPSDCSASSHAGLLECQASLLPHGEPVPRFDRRPQRQHRRCAACVPGTPVPAAPEDCAGSDRHGSPPAIGRGRHAPPAGSPPLGAQRGWSPRLSTRRADRACGRGDQRSTCALSCIRRSPSRMLLARASPTPSTACSSSMPAARIVGMVVKRRIRRSVTLSGRRGMRASSR